jgi:predicted nuclease with TOPRIM domain
MYDHNDRIAEELSNYCTDLREQLSDSKRTVTWLCDQKAEVQKTVDEKVALLESSWTRVNDLEISNKVLGERVKYLEGQLNGALS